MADYTLTLCGGAEHVVGIGSKILSYESGHWPAIDLEDTKRSMYRECPPLKRREADDAIKILATLTDDKKFGETSGLAPREDPKRQRICLDNGTLNLITGDLEEHAASHQILHKLGFAWSEEALCPIYDDVVQTTFNGDEKCIQLWDEWCGLSLVPDNSFQKLVFLRGPGGNGKGTLSRVLRSMHDPNAISSVAITDLNDERKRTSLVGKLLNISGEQSYLNKISDSYLKKITGEDPVDIRLLYGETKNNVILPVRFLELVNEMPATSDVSEALRRRLIILPTPVKVLHPDLQLDGKLKNERPGILCRWVKALHTLYERQAFDIPQCSISAVGEYLSESNPVCRWIEDCCLPAKDEVGLPNVELYSSFSEWHRANGYTGKFSSMMWGRRLAELGHESTVHSIGGISVRCRPLKLTNRGDF